MSSTPPRNPVPGGQKGGQSTCGFASLRGRRKHADCGVDIMLEAFPLSRVTMDHVLPRGVLPTTRTCATLDEKTFKDANMEYAVKAHTKIIHEQIANNQQI